MLAIHETIPKFISLLTLSFGICLHASPTSAQEIPLPRLASVGIFSNDTYFDGQDRWRTGSYQRSFLWQNTRQELRIRAEYIAPQSLDISDFDPQNDRPFAAILKTAYQYHLVDGHSVWGFGGYVESINNLDFLNDFMNKSHKALNFNSSHLGGYRVKPKTVLGFETSWRYEYQYNAGYILPFWEAELGSRERVTMGADFIFTKNNYSFHTRDQTTGHILGSPITKYGSREVSFDVLAGFDVSRVSYDYFLDNGISNVTRENYRQRGRLGGRLNLGAGSIFIGPTYLSPEFKEQKQGQFLQSISIHLAF